MYDGSFCVIVAQIWAVRTYFHTIVGQKGETRNNGISSNNRYDYVTDTFMERQKTKDLASVNRVPEFKS